MLGFAGRRSGLLGPAAWPLTSTVALSDYIDHIAFFECAHHSNLMEFDYYNRNWSSTSSPLQAFWLFRSLVEADEIKLLN